MKGRFSIMVEKDLFDRIWSLSKRTNLPWAALLKRALDSLEKDIRASEDEAKSSPR